MNEENLVETTENTEKTVEQPVEKTYTEEEFNEKLNQVIGRKLARQERKLRREYDHKYQELENVLKAGTGQDDIDDITDTFKDYYESQGIEIPETSVLYDERETEILAKADADEIINLGLDEVSDEINRLSLLGVDNMSMREQVMYKRLNDFKRNAIRSREVHALGLKDDELQDFNNFAKQFNSSISNQDIYNIYQKTKQTFEPMGSMKSTKTEDDGVKDFYTVEEAKKFTKADFDENPKLFEAVKNSMTKWR